MFKKYYFFIAKAINKKKENRILQFIVKSKNPLEAYREFEEYTEEQECFDFNIEKFYKID